MFVKSHHLGILIGAIFVLMIVHMINNTSSMEYAVTLFSLPKNDFNKNNIAEQRRYVP